MSSINHTEKSLEQNMSKYYEKLGKIEKISITDSKLLERLKNTDISKYHPLLSAYESMSAGDETTSWDNYKYKTQ